MSKIRYYGVYIVLIIYILLSLLIDPNYPSIFSRLINPLFYVIITISLYIITQNKHGRFPEAKDYTKKMLIMLLLYLITYTLIGLVFGYNRNALSHNLIPLIKNVWSLIVPVIGIEYIRSVLINYNKNNKYVIIPTIILLVILELDFSYIFKLNGSEELFKYIFSKGVSIASFSLLFSFLATKGNYKVNLMFRIPYLLYGILIPILPDIDWFVEGIIGLVAPTIIYVLFRYNFEKMAATKRQIKKEKPYTYIPVILFIALLASFMLGLFSYMPIVIMSNSMVPTFSRGSVVVLEKVDEEKIKNIKKDDIIVYNIDKQYIVHKVIGIRYQKGRRVFITKGDANKDKDYLPVDEDHVVGIYKFSIEYIGYPSIWLNEFFNKTKPKVETGD